MYIEFSSAMNGWQLNFYFYFFTLLLGLQRCRQTTCFVFTILLFFIKCILLQGSHVSVLFGSFYESWFWMRRGRMVSGVITCRASLTYWLHVRFLDWAPVLGALLVFKLFQILHSPYLIRKFIFFLSLEIYNRYIKHVSPSLFDFNSFAPRWFLDPRWKAHGLSRSRSSPSLSCFAILCLGCCSPCISCWCLNPMFTTKMISSLWHFALVFIQAVIWLLVLFDPFTC